MGLGVGEEGRGVSGERHTAAAVAGGRRLLTLAARADVITYEFENVPLASVEYLAGRMPVHPAPAALAEAVQCRCSPSGSSRTKAL